MAVFDSTQVPPVPSPVQVVRGRWERLRSGAVILLGDVLAIVLAVALVSDPPLSFEVTTGLLLIFVLVLWGLYQPRMTLSVLDDLPRILASVVTAAAVGAVLVALFTRDGIDTSDQIFVLALTIFTLVLRATSYWFLKWRRRHGDLCARTVILGAGEVAKSVGEAMIENGSYGCELVGFVDSDPRHSSRQLPAPVLADTEHIAGVIDVERVDRMILAFLQVPEAELVPVIQTCDRAEVEIFVVPRLFEMTATMGNADEIDGIPLFRMHRAPFRSPTWLLKRVMDIAVSGFALLVLSPLLIVLALMDRIVDGPGIIFRQERVGIDGREFGVLKFRSMRPATESESATNWNIKNDDRLSWYGKFLRRSSLDELPQLWNILRGDMSLVGPRPERPHFVEQFSDKYDRYWARHRVPCGLTGWAQIHGLRGDTSIAERVRYDNYYIQNWSLWLDIKIIIRTMTRFTKGSG